MKFRFARRHQEVKRPLPSTRSGLACALVALVVAARTTAAAEGVPAPPPVVATPANSVVRPPIANASFAAEIGDGDAPLWKVTAARVSAVDVDEEGRRLVADRDANSVAWYGADGTLIDSFAVGAPLDADFLADGHILITSLGERSVIEIDRDKRTVWERDDLAMPRAAQRLEGGNTLIAETQPPRVIEVDREGKIVWSYKGDLLMPAAVRPYGKDEIVVADYNRHRIDCIRRDGSICWRVNHIGHPSQLFVLADGGLLVAAHKAGGIVHVATDHTIRGYWRLTRDLEDFALAGDRLLLAIRPRGDQPALAALQTPARRVLTSVQRGSRRFQIHPALTELPDVDTRRRNLVLILFDSLRRDHMPWEGYWRRTMPVVAQLSRRSTTFSQYITQAPWTKPSVASLFTSTYPSTHQATSQKPYSQMPISLITIAETLREAGYFTAAVMENPHMGDRKTAKGFDQGYETYVFLGESKYAEQMPGLMADRAIEILRDRPTDKPIFLTMFFMNPHYPYKPHSFFFGDEETGPSNPGSQNSYDAEIREADTSIGRVLDELRAQGLDERTIVVFTSDHGEEFMDHGKRFHGDTLFDCVLNPPLLIAGIDRVGRFPGLVREIDLFPTLLDYLGVTPSPALQAQTAGVSVRPYLERGAAATGLVAYSETRFRNGMRMVSERSEKRAVIADVAQRNVRIYDLASDPQQYNDIATAADQKAELRRLVRWQKSLRKVEREPRSREGLSAADLERLRQAGYLTEAK